MSNPKEIVFSAVVLTAPPPGQTGDAGGALIKVDGRESLLRCVELFLNRPNIPQIILVVAPDAEEEAKRKFGGTLGFMGVKLVIGGKKWSEQIAAAAPRISAESTNVLIHDAARPITPFGDIDAVLETAAKHPAVALVSGLRSSLIETDEGGSPMAFHQQNSFVQLLTPQVYSRQRFLDIAAGREIHPSELTLVKGWGMNLRLSGASDASLAKALLNLLPKPKVKAPSNPFEEAQW
jgi:2-C-methyl-D-erythritol 4-phosphate cytidylyltransferase